MSLPFTDVVAAARAAGNRAGMFPVISLSKALASAAPIDTAQTALLLARLSAGASVATPTAREIELELGALTPEARSLARVLAPVLTQHDIAAVIQRALAGIGMAMSAVFGAVVPAAVVVDATILQACRECHWGAERLVEKDRPRELLRRLARALGLPVIDSKGPEDAETSARKLAALDPELAAAEARTRTLEKELRARLPLV